MVDWRLSEQLKIELMHKIDWDIKQELKIEQ